jgi:hypothetical protein
MRIGLVFILKLNKGIFSPFLPGDLALPVSKQKIIVCFGQDSILQKLFKGKICKL